MSENQRYVVQSLELHLFFARIMKEHSLFLKAGFTSANPPYIKEADFYMQQFDRLLNQAIGLSNGIVSRNLLQSGEIVTEFTVGAEQQTQHFTGIPINENTTARELALRSGENVNVTPELTRQVKQLNQNSLQLLDGLIALKENILSNVLNCHMFTMNYPLLIEHIIREAKLYRTYIQNYENGMIFDSQTMKEIEQFWNEIMMEHALFIRGLLDPTENALIETSDAFAKDYARLLETSRDRHDRTMMNGRESSLQETIKFRDFKIAGNQGIQGCKIRSIILPLLADHVLREANHYIRLLNE